jgi:hypothetical protein
MAGKKRPITTSRIYSDLARRIRVVTAATGSNAADLLDKICTPALDKLEQEHVPSRYRSTRPTDHSKPIE